MIKLLDIQNHVVKKLKDSFPKHRIYREENRTNPETPAFYVDVRPLTTTGRQRYNNKLTNVTIQYISDRKSKQENLEMMDKLGDIFYLAIEINGRRLTIPELSISEGGGILTVGFTLDYNTDFKSGAGISSSEDLGYGEGKTKKMEELYYNGGDL